MRRPAFTAFCTACALWSFSLLNLASAADSEPGPPVLRKASDIALSVDDETLERQYRALSSMPSVVVAYSALGPVKLVQGNTGVELSRTTRDLRVDQEAPEILQKLKDVLLASGGETLKVRWNDNSSIGRTIRTDQFIAGIPVLYGTVSVGVDDSTGLVDVVGASFLPDRGLPRQPKISEKEAGTLAEQQLVKYGIAKPGSVKTGTPTLAYAGTHPSSTKGHLVWVVPATYTAQAGSADDGIFWFDAIDGALVGQDALTKGAALKVFTGNSNTNLIDFDDGIESVLTLLFTSPGSTTDGIAMNAYTNLSASMAADEAQVGYLQTRDIGLIVHTGSGWHSARATRKTISGVTRDYLLFGDGSGATLTGPIGNSRDAVAHEYGHVISTALFAPFGGDPSDAQSAAIDEAFGDINAALVDSWFRSGHLPSDPATWTIAEIFPGDPTRGIRSLKNPKSMDLDSRDWFPARELGLAKFTRHDNATIMGHAFKLLANPPTGGFHVRAGQPIIDSNVPGNIPVSLLRDSDPPKLGIFSGRHSGSQVLLPTLRCLRSKQQQ